MATDWKAKYDAAMEECDYMSDECAEAELENKRLLGKYSALKGQLTRERKKNAEALELVELLEWARNKELEVNINRIFTTVFQALSNKKADVLARKDSPIESLRAAKKAVEVGK